MRNGFLTSFLISMVGYNRTPGEFLIYSACFALGTFLNWPDLGLVDVDG